MNFMNIMKIRNNSSRCGSTLNSTLKCTKTDSVQIFQVYPPRNSVSIADVENVMHMTANMNAVDKKNIYDTYGIDHEKVNKYYGTVMYLERMYSMNSKWSESSSNLLYHIIVSVWRFVTKCILMFLRAL